MKNAERNLKSAPSWVTSMEAVLPWGLADLENRWKGPTARVRAHPLIKSHERTSGEGSFVIPQTSSVCVGGEQQPKKKIQPGMGHWVEGARTGDRRPSQFRGQEQPLLGVQFLAAP